MTPVSFLKKIPVLQTGAALCTGLFLFLTISLSLMVPQIMPLIPGALMLLLGYGGTSWAAFAIGLCAGLGMLMYGWIGAVCMLLLCVPMTAVSLFCVRKSYDFWKSAMAIGVSILLSMASAALLLSALAGTDVISALSGMLSAWLTASGAYADRMLLSLAEMGIIDKPEGIYALSGVLSSIDRAAMSGALIRFLDAGLRLEMPAEILGCALLGGTVGQGIFRAGCRRRGLTAESVPMAHWMVPSGWGTILGGTLALALVLYYTDLIRSGVAYTFENTFIRVFAVQGIAALWYLLEQKKMKRIWCIPLAIAGLTVLSTYACVIGIGDQIFDFTKRRAALGDR